MSPLTVEEIVRRYQDGEGSKRLGKAYGVDHKIILAVVRQAGIAIRPGRPWPAVEAKLRAHGEEIVRRYQSGESLSALRLAYGLSFEPLRRLLHDHDVPIRSAREQLRQSRDLV